MDNNMKQLWDIKSQKLIESFHKNNIECTFVEDIEELHTLLKPILVGKKTVNVGGSMTLFETGIIDLIRESDVTFYDRYAQNLTPEDIRKIFLQAFDADLYFTSSNAITMDGSLYNIDGNGNRVAAMIYGPKDVYIIAGINKIFNTEEEAINHIKTVSAPANAIRLNKNTPCAKTGKCMNCLSDERICSDYVKMARQINHRLHVIIVKKELGY